MGKSIDLNMIHSLVILPLWSESIQVEDSLATKEHFYHHHENSEEISNQACSMNEENSYHDNNKGENDIFDNELPDGDQKEEKEMDNENARVESTNVEEKSETKSLVNEKHKEQESDTFTSSQQINTLSFDSPFEDAIYNFLTRYHKSSSPISFFAIECTGSLILSLISTIMKQIVMTKGEFKFEYLKKWKKLSKVIQGVEKSKAYYAKNVVQLQDSAQVSELFVDLVE